MCSYRFFYAFKACKNIEMLVKSLHAAKNIRRRGRHAFPAAEFNLV